MIKNLAVLDVLGSAWKIQRGWKRDFWSGLMLWIGIGFFMELLSTVLMLWGMILIYEYQQDTFIGSTLIYIGKGLDYVVKSLLFICILAGATIAVLRRFSQVPCQAKEQLAILNFSLLLKLSSYFLVILLIDLFYFFVFCLPLKLDMNAIVSSVKVPSLPFGFGLGNGDFFLLMWLLFGTALFALVSIRLSMSWMILLDKNSGIITALKSSIAATKGHEIRIAMIHAVMVVLIGLSLLPFGLGLIWTVPIYFVVMVELYRRLIGEESD